MESSVQTLQLISGTFTPEDALEILSDMIRSKINYHNLKNYTSIIRFDEEDQASTQRIKELSEMKEEISYQIRTAGLMNKKVKLYSSVYIEFED